MKAVVLLGLALVVLGCSEVRRRPSPDELIGDYSICGPSGGPEHLRLDKDRFRHTIGEGPQARVEVGTWKVNSSTPNSSFVGLDRVCMPWSPFGPKHCTGADFEAYIDRRGRVRLVANGDLGIYFVKGGCK